LGHTTINHKAVAIAADGGRGGGNGVSRGCSKDSGRGGGGDVGANSFGNDRGRQRQGQTTINQKVAEMAVKAVATAAVAEAKTVAEGRWQRRR
jgi:hypothetical protein